MGAKYPNGLGGQHLPTIKRKVQPCVQERASIADWTSDGRFGVWVGTGNLGSLSITQDGLSIRKVNLCGVCSLRVKANSVLCVQCVKRIHSGCARVKRVTPRFKKNCICQKCEGNI